MKIMIDSEKKKERLVSLNAFLIAKK